jgi:hypothetical protein
MKPGFEVDDDGAVILYTESTLRANDGSVRMSPRFVKEMYHAIREWENDRSIANYENRMAGKWPVKARGATAVDPDGIERGWVAEDIYE